MRMACSEDRCCGGKNNGLQLSPPSRERKRRPPTVPASSVPSICGSAWIRLIGLSRPLRASAHIDATTKMKISAGARLARDEHRIRDIKHDLPHLMIVPTGRGRRVGYCGLKIDPLLSGVSRDNPPNKRWLVGFVSLLIE